MPYTEKLSQLITSSGLTVKEIAARCAEYGLEITPSYISILRREGSGRVPSDEVSRVIARVCGGDEAELVLAGYFDRAPNEFLNLLEKLREAAGLDASASFPEITNRLTHILCAKNEPGGAKKKLRPFDYTMPDNAMAPLIPKNARCTLETLDAVEEYSGGDILLVRINGEKDSILRKCVFSNAKKTKLVLMPVHPNAAPLVVRREDVIIEGRVRSFTVDL